MPETEFIYPDWPAPQQVRALSTKRVGGVSRAPFDSLNLGSHVDDNRVHVATNRQMLTQQAILPSQPYWLNQVHGTHIIEFNMANTANIDMPTDADGALTRQAGVVCGILTADCMPVLLTNRAGNTVAAVHVGWRGLANGILEDAVVSMNCPAEQIIAWAGPCIGPASFVVGMNVREQLGGPNSAYQPAGKGKVYADLVQLAKQRLNVLGVTAFSASHACTYANETDFFSYRRDGQCGRMATLVWIEPA